jgi:threonine aldolase
VRDDNEHYPISRLVILENTHNRCGGVPLSVDYTRQVGSLAHSAGLKLHIDGARIFNASVALGVNAAELAEPGDSITFCLSKGLCAPVGSLLCGSKDFIYRAHRTRKQLGGGMRQVGVLAAAGIVALDKMTDRLVEDHANARRLAELLSGVPGLVLDKGLPSTNMVFISLGESIPLPANEVTELLKNEGVLVGGSSARGFRLVTHFWVKAGDVDKVVKAFLKVLSAK